MHHPALERRLLHVRMMYVADEADLASMVLMAGERVRDPQLILSRVVGPSSFVVVNSVDNRCDAFTICCHFTDQETTHPGWWIKKTITRDDSMDLRVEIERFALGLIRDQHGVEYVYRAAHPPMVPPEQGWVALLEGAGTRFQLNGVVSSRLCLYQIDLR